MKKFVSPRATFKGELQGIKVEDLTGCDYDLLSFKERIQFIESKLKQVDEFDLDEYDFSIDEEVEEQLDEERLSVQASSKRILDLHSLC